MSDLTDSLDRPGLKAMASVTFGEINGEVKGSFGALDERGRYKLIGDVAGKPADVLRCMRDAVRTLERKYPEL